MYCHDGGGGKGDGDDDCNNSSPYTELCKLNKSLKRKTIYAGINAIVKFLMLFMRYFPFA